MKTKKEILKWLQANLGPRSIAGLTSTDTYALVTSVNLSNLISYESAPQRLFDAWGAIVSEMQEHNRHLAFHVVACELDWSHRFMIWERAFGDRVRPESVCCFEPGGGGEERSEQLRRQK